VPAISLRCAKRFACAARTCSSGRAADLDRAAAIVLPGVGHFAATASLDESWRSAIRRRLEAGVPFLGICLGMQWLFEGQRRSAGRPRSRVAARPDHAPAGPHAGRRPAEGAACRLERCARRGPSRVPGLRDGAYFYFTHAYAAPVTDATAATTMYGSPFASAVRRGPVCGVQFHPEKSGAEGLAVLGTFVGGVR